MSYSVSSGMGRRALIAGLAAATAGAAVGIPHSALAETRPLARPSGLAPARPGPAPDSFAPILERFGLAAATGFAVADAATGAVIEAHQPGIDRPPASVAKIVTALYALDRLGPGHAFETRIEAAGDALVLAGGGDPLLDTDALGDLAAAAAAAGPGTPARLVVDAGALPSFAEIEADQPEDAGYNPAISGMNLNFNRVHLAWEPGEAGPRLRLSAPGLRHDVETPGIAAVLEAGATPPRHRVEGGREVWALAPASLRGRGSVWLPVRAPAAYAGETFRALAAGAGLVLPAPEAVSARDPAGSAAPAARMLARRESERLEPMMRGMLHYSTNLTAEAAGLAASQRAGAPAGSLAASAGAMSAWARGRYGLDRLALVNHSGLTARSRVTAADMARLLVAAAPGGLPGLLRERPLKGADGAPAPVEGVRIVAKTGTLDFVSALAGYIEGPGERRRAFAILAADLDAREATPPELRDDPPGAAAFARRARAQEQALLRRWIALEAA